VFAVNLGRWVQQVTRNALRNTGFQRSARSFAAYSRLENHAYGQCFTAPFTSGAAISPFLELVVGIDRGINLAILRHA
jgi:hypothetical protein